MDDNRSVQLRILPSKQKLGIGLFYLVPAYFQEPAPNPAVIPGFTNPHMKGVAARITWERLYKDGYGTPNYTWLDSVFSYAESNGKLVYIQLEAGINSPPAFFQLPGVPQYLAGADNELCSLNFDPVFQSEFSTAITGIANRYVSHSSFKWIKISGMGTASESAIAINQAQWDAIDAIAAGLGYADKFAAYYAGGTFLIDLYASLFTPKSFQLITGSPFGSLAGSIPLLQSLYDYGDLHHRGPFAACAHNLNAVSPRAGEIGQTEITLLSPHSTATGYQMHNEMSTPALLNTALNSIGIPFGAHEIEVFAGNADDPACAAILDEANARMLSV